MYKDAFQKLEPEEAESILTKAKPHLDGVTFDMSHVTILSHELPFYDGYVFYDIGDFSAAKSIHRYVVMNDNDKNITVLDWTSAPVQLLNKAAPIALSEETIGDYVRFYFAYVRGEHGRFILVENVDDIYWRDDPSPSARKAVGNMITPLTLDEGRTDGGFNLEGTVCFRNALFKIDFTIDADGTLNIANQELLLEDLPVLDDVFGQ